MFLAGALIVLLCMLAYLPAMQGKFLWDDLYLVGANPFFRSPRFVLEVFRHYLFVDSFSAYYRPVQNISYMLDYLIWDQQEFGYHLSNVLFHAASAFFLYLVLRRCLGRVGQDGQGGQDGQDGQDGARAPGFSDGAAFCVALLWAVHPIHNAAVAYVAGRADSLAMMFALGGWLLFTTEAAGWRAAASAGFAAICFLAALCAKEIAFVWIALFLVYLFAFERGRSLRVKVLITGMLLAVLAVYLVLRHLPGSRVPPQGPEVDPLAERFLLMFLALGQYTALIFFPANLHMERVLWTGQEYAGLESWVGVLRGNFVFSLGLLTICLFAFACWSRLPGRRIRIFGVVWFVLGFLPISNLFPLNAQAAEHWIYLASAGYILMLAGFACALPARHGRLLLAAMPLALAALSVRTAYRAAEWANPETFYRQTIAAGGSSDRASLNLAEIYAERGDLKAAEGVLRDTLRRFPGFASARLELGRIMIGEGRAKEAEAALKFSPAAEAQVAAAVPSTWTAALNLAHIQYSSGHAEAALAILDESLKRYPEIWDIVYFRAQILWITKGADAALPGIRQYAASHWWHYGSHRMLGQLLARAGDYAGGMAASRDAATLDIHNPEPYDDMARAAVRANRLPDALKAQSEGLARSPDEPHEYKLMAAILEKMNMQAEAAAARGKAELLSGG
jgi:tetratricopeptide (TPR) repeat protein